MSATALAALIVAVSTLLGVVLDRLAKRREEALDLRRQKADEVLDPVTTAAAITVEFAKALENIVAPLNREVAALRKTTERLQRRVRILTDVLVSHNITIPSDDAED